MKPVSKTKRLWIKLVYGGPMSLLFKNLVTAAISLVFSFFASKVEVLAQYFTPEQIAAVIYPAILLVIYELTQKKLKSGVKVLQLAANELGEEIDVDGFVGEQTLETLNELTPLPLNRTL